jgi:SAM-dependent methyltransferase
MEPQLTPHARVNQAYWDGEADWMAEPGRVAWASDEMSWGIWGVPERGIDIVPDVEGLDIVELGCGTAYWSAWFTRRGGRPIGVDLSERQLATARELQTQHGVEFPLLHASAEEVPLPDVSFDLAFSEYGASLWCDPYLWIPEAARLLRPGGRLIFLTSSVLRVLCSADEDEVIGERLVRDQFGLHSITWPDDGSTEFHLPHGERIRLLRDCGFEIEVLHEVQVNEDAPPSRYTFVSKEWCRRWPVEEIWRARKRDGCLDNQRA